jgi:hypothetical protein
MAAAVAIADELEEVEMEKFRTLVKASAGARL